MLNKPLTPASPDPGTYTDLQSLTALKKAAREQSPEALQRTARQFEAEFLKMMLSSMRKAGGEEGGILDSDQSHFYRDMLDEQLAVTLSRRGGIGLADRIVRQLGGEPAPAPAPAPQAPVNLPPAAVTPRFGGPRSAPTDAGPAAGKADVAPAAPGPDRFDSPEGFVRAMRDHARGAARRLGVSPEVLIAQAALESGWGRSLPRHPDGRSSHNLFGIKAHGGWEGPRVVNGTLEFEGGVFQRRQAGFRAYGSYAESFQDYVRFLRDNPRYRTALGQAHDPEAFVRELQAAGYATDPRYADKILKIMDSEPFRDLKLAAAGPINRTEP